MAWTADDEQRYQARLAQGQSKPAPAWSDDDEKKYQAKLDQKNLEMHAKLVERMSTPQMSASKSWDKSQDITTPPASETAGQVGRGLGEAALGLAPAAGVAAAGMLGGPVAAGLAGLGIVGASVATSPDAATVARGLFPPTAIADAAIQANQGGLQNRVARIGNALGQVGIMGLMTRPSLRAPELPPITRLPSAIPESNQAPNSFAQDMFRRAASGVNSPVGVLRPDARPAPPEAPLTFRLNEATAERVTRATPIQEPKVPWAGDAQAPQVTVDRPPIQPPRIAEDAYGQYNEPITPPPPLPRAPLLPPGQEQTQPGANPPPVPTGRESMPMPPPVLDAEKAWTWDVGESKNKIPQPKPSGQILPLSGASMSPGPAPMPKGAPVYKKPTITGSPMGEFEPPPPPTLGGAAAQGIRLKAKPDEYFPRPQDDMGFGSEDKTWIRPTKPPPPPLANVEAPRPDWITRPEQPQPNWTPRLERPPAPAPAIGSPPPPPPVAPTGPGYYQRKTPILRPDGSPNIMALEDIGGEAKVDPIPPLGKSNVMTGILRKPAASELFGGPTGLQAQAARTKAYATDFYNTRLQRAKEFIGKPIEEFPEAVGQAVHAMAENTATPEQVALVQSDPAAGRFLAAYKDIVSTAAKESLKDAPLIDIPGLRENYATHQRTPEGVSIRDLFGNMDLKRVMSSDLPPSLKQGFQRFREGTTEGPFDARDGMKILLRQYGDNIYKTPFHSAAASEINRKLWPAQDAPFAHAQPERDLASYYMKHNYEGHATPQEQAIVQAFHDASQIPGISHVLGAYDALRQAPGLKQVGDALHGLAKATGMELDPHKPISTVLGKVKSVVHNVIPSPPSTAMKHLVGDVTTQYIESGLPSFPKRVTSDAAFIVKRFLGMEPEKMAILQREGIVTPHWSQTDHYWQQIPQKIQSFINVAKTLDDASKAVTWDSVYTSALKNGMPEMQARRMASAVSYRLNNFGGDVHKAPYLSSPLGHVIDTFNVGRMNFDNNIYDWFTKGEGSTWAKGAGLVGAVVLAEQMGVHAAKLFHVAPSLPSPDLLKKTVTPSQWWPNR